MTVCSAAYSLSLSVLQYQHESKHQLAIIIMLDDITHLVVCVYRSTEKEIIGDKEIDD